MHISARSDYAVRAMLTLAAAEGEDPVSVQRLVRRLGDVPADRMQRLSSVLRLLMEL